MPEIRRKLTSLRSTTKDGEITINLNLNITVDGSGGINVDASASRETESVTPEVQKKAEIVPTELFSSDDDLIEGFGE